MLIPRPPSASTAALPLNHAKQRFNAHPVLTQGRACARGGGGVSDYETRSVLTLDPPPPRYVLVLKHSF